MFRKVVGKAKRWTVGRCRHEQDPELFSMEVYDQAEVYFLAATDVGK